MKIEAFIPDWPGEKQHAAELVNVLARRYPTRILDNPKDYFNAQWEKACDLFTGDVLLWVMADAGIPSNFQHVCTEMESVMARADVGWYAPDIAWTSYMYNRSELCSIGNGLYEVPNTDSVLFAVRADVIRNMPRINPDMCFMWGMDVVASTVIRQMNLKMVRDYKFQISHPKTTGYNIERASVEMGNLFKSLEPGFAKEVKKSIDEMNRLKKEVAS